MQPFSLLVKPAGADCNLRCSYCFYLQKGALYPQKRPHRMTDATLQAMLENYMATRQPVYSFVWQGGEPTLMGAPFFRRVVELQKRCAPKGAQIANSLQTNATCIDAKLAACMGHYRFLAGCSIDGPPSVHDASRRTKDGRPSHARVVRGIETLQRHGVPVNAVTLVSAANVQRPLEVYRHLMALGMQHVQFIPCVEFDAKGNLQPYAITGEQWGRFLLDVFEEWYSRADWGTCVRNFESLLARLTYGVATECRLHSRCDQYLVVEHNGDVYPCDFFVSQEHLLGNVHTTGFQEIRQSFAYKKFAAAKEVLPPLCHDCEYLSLCMGDCPRYQTVHVNGQQGGAANWLCEGWRLFFDATLSRFKGMANGIAAGLHCHPG